MAREVSVEAVLDALGSVKFPRYATDIVSLGIIEEVLPLTGGAIAVTLRQATERDEVMGELGAQVRRLLARDLGVPHVELRVHRLKPELGERTGRARLEGTRFVIAVASGKGGVGKSTVAANLAVALSRLGHRVGLLDADIYGPSLPTMFGTGAERPRMNTPQSFFPVERHGVKLISIGFFLTERAPVIWRGPMVMSAVRQFLKDTLWGTQDFLVVDLPPGTGDAQITLAQQVALDGVLIVTTPQELALLDAARALKMFRQVHCPLLGVVENMSYFECDGCGEREELFGTGGGERLAAAEGTRLLLRIPLYPELREAGDAGVPLTVAAPEHPASRAFMELAGQVAELMPA